MVIKIIADGGLKVNQKKSQLWELQVNYLGFQAYTEMVLSNGFREKLKQICPLFNYVKNPDLNEQT